jgi:hypothetical protein
MHFTWQTVSNISWFFITFLYTVLCGILDFSSLLIRFNYCHRCGTLLYNINAFSVGGQDVYHPWSSGTSMILQMTYFCLQFGKYLNTLVPFKSHSQCHNVSNHLPIPGLVGKKCKNVSLDCRCNLRSQWRSTEASFCCSPKIGRMSISEDPRYHTRRLN